MNCDCMLGVPDAGCRCRCHRIGEVACAVVDKQIFLEMQRLLEECDEVERLNRYQVEEHRPA